MGLVIRKYVSSCQTNSDGLVIQKKIQECTNNKIVLDFHNIDFVSSSFLNTAFVEIVEEWGIENFKNKIKIINVNPSIKKSLQRRFSSL